MQLLFPPPHSLFLSLRQVEGAKSFPFLHGFIFISHGAQRTDPGTNRIFFCVLSSGEMGIFGVASFFIFDLNLALSLVASWSVVCTWDWLCWIGR